MRHFQQKFFSVSIRPSAPLLTLLVAFASVIGFGARAHAQAAPYVLPYTMSTFAGPNANYTVGALCNGSTTLHALDAQGDGCLASQVSVGIDPHDIRVDAKGNVYWLDNASGSLTLVHKINATTLQSTVYLGSNTNASPCSGHADAYGDNCPSTDGAANANSVILTTATKLKNQRGLAIAPNGDLYTAGYNDYNIHKVSAALSPFTYSTPTGTTPATTIYAPIFSQIAGITSITTTTASVAPGPAFSGLGSSRGVGVDAAGNVYIADTGNSIIQEVTSNSTLCGSITPPCLIPLTAPNAAATKTVTSGVAANTAIVNAPEDAQTDSYGNIYIADAGNNVLRVIYVAGTIPGIPVPTPGFIYTIAGGGATAYPKDGTTPTLLGTSIAITLRKIGIDSRNNIYIADSGSDVVWFVDATTGYIRVAAGSYGGAVTSALSVPYGCPTSTNSIGDGCPASLAALTVSSNMGTSPDNQGNLYITDEELTTTNAASATASRLRKVLSGLNFPATATGTAVTQTLLVHYGPLDTPSATAPFAVTGTDFTLGPQSCTLNLDTTTDCKLPVIFKPSVPGYDTATLSFTATLGGLNTYLLTGTGSAPAIAIDPGSASLTNSTINNAQGAAVDGTGNLYVADTANNRVLKITPAGVTSTLVGTGLNGPRAVAVDTTGNIYIADTGNNVIRKVSTTGVVSVYAGTGTANYTGDYGLAKAATFSAPSGLTADNQGQIYVADTGNNVIRQISADGFIYTIAGGATTVCTTSTDNQGDGCAGLLASFSGPTGLAYDATGSFILVADTGNSNVRKINISNAIVTSPTTPAITIGDLNLVTLVAGNGQSGNSVSASGAANASQLSKPTGVAVDAAENVYVADTGNSAIRLVNSGNISTIVGILGTSGTGTALPTSAINVQLATPGTVAVTSLGALYIVDSGNNRVITDNRSQISYNFGRTNVGSSSPAQPFTELNIGILAATLPTTAAQITATGSTTQFTLTPPTGSTGCSLGLSLAIGVSCITNGQFTPTAASVTPYTATYTDTPAYSGVNPSITLVGTGAVLTPTTSTIAQTSPTGSAQFGAPLTLTATVASACNAAAPSCTPTGTMKIIVDGTSSAPIALTGNTASETLSTLSVGTHTIACTYSGDNFYASSNCQTTPAITITVIQATTTSLLTLSPNNAPQFTTVTLTANVISSTVGTPTGTVNFYADGSTTPLNASPVSLTGGVASTTLAPIYFNNSPANPVIGAGNTLTPGTHAITCIYTGPNPSNYASSTCAAVSLTVAPQTTAIQLFPRACSTNVLTLDGTQTTSTTPPLTLGTLCNPGPTTNAPIPTVAVADGATTDVTLLILASNTLTGNMSFACNGMPATTICTFSPQTLPLTASTAAPGLQIVDVTLWTDIKTSALSQPSVGPSIGQGRSGANYALIVGWPALLIGLVALIRFRRKPGSARALSMLAMLLLMAGSTLLVTSCAGPGSYTPALTPAASYPITITATGGGATGTAQVIFKVTSPGIAGQQ